MAQSTELKGRGNTQLNPLKTVVLKYTGIRISEVICITEIRICLILP